MKLYLEPTPENAPDNNGIGRVAQAQFEYLPKLGVQFVSKPEKADVVACHVEHQSLAHVDVLHVHGLYFEDLPHYPYDAWHYKANRRIIATARRSRFLTVPSPWVAKPFQRDMRIDPLVVPHGIKLAQWEPDENRGYLLWNKGRADDVCDPTPIWELANRGITAISTYTPIGKAPGKLRVTDQLPFEKMRTLIRSADIYLATTPETFGIGTIEAMAAGVPVLGYKWAGTADLIVHGETGYLVEPGDIDGLQEGYEWLRTNRAAISANAREFAKGFDWPNVMGGYIEVYERAMTTPKESGVAIIIPSYNYAQYLPACLDSVLAQTRKPNDIVVIDDGSTDNTAEVIVPYLAKGVRYLSQSNQGVAAARMHGLLATSASFVTMLDADDQIAPEFVLALERALVADPALGIAYTALGLVDSDSNKPRGSDGWPKDFDWKVQSQGGVPPGNCIPSGCMFRRSLYERGGRAIYQEFAPGEDAEMWTRGLAAGFTAKKISNDHLFWYRQHPGGASKVRKYKPVDSWLPWIRDKEYPMAAPVGEKERVRVTSYFMPDISVIIPVGPGHEYILADAIRSLEGQTFRNWELIVVADTDIPLTEAARFPFAQFVTGRRTGAGAARNDGMKLVKGKFVVFLDADDYLHPEALEKMLLAYDQHGYVYSDYYRVEGGETNPTELKDYDPDKWGLQHAVTTLMPTEWARKISFDESLPAWEDVDYYQQARAKGFCGVRLPEFLLYYRLDTGRRRATAKSQESSLTTYLEKRHKARKTMACGSCGGTAAGSIILDAKKRMTMNTQPTNTERIGEAPVTTRLEFIGDQTGAVSFNINRRIYRGGKNNTNRFIDALNEDVDGLLKTGRWIIVARPVAPVVTAPPPTPMAMRPAPMATPATNPIVTPADSQMANHVAAPAVAPMANPVVTAVEQRTNHVAAPAVSPMATPEATKMANPAEKPVVVAREQSQASKMADLVMSELRGEATPEMTAEALGEVKAPFTPFTPAKTTSKPKIAPMPTGLKELRAAVSTADLDVVREWLHVEKMRGESARKPYIAVMEKGMEARELGGE